MAAGKPISYAAVLSGSNGERKDATQGSQIESSETSSLETPEKDKRTHESLTQQNDAPSLNIRRTSKVPNTAAAPYKRHDAYIPNTSNPSGELYVLALRTDKAHHTALNALRDKYFPRHMNKVSAHIAFFHALPESKLEEIISDLYALARQQQMFPIKTSEPFKLARGVGISISSGAEESNAIFQTLQAKWRPFLSQQDNRKFRSHYTIMNKVDDEERIEDCLRAVQESFDPNEGVVQGLNLFRYEKGFWRFIRSWTFRERR